MRINAAICLSLAMLSYGALVAAAQINGNRPDPRQDDHTIGSVNDKWLKVESDGGQIYVKTNGLYFPITRYSGHLYQGADGKTDDTLVERTAYGFHTYIVANLPESDIVGAPQSIMHDIEGDCEARTYHLLGSLFFAGKNRSGGAMDSIPAENVQRKLIAKSPLEKAFDMLCKAAPAATGSAQVETPSQPEVKRAYPDAKPKYR